jgi:hypothetical protein
MRKVVLLILVFLLTGCSGFHALFKPDPSVALLSVTPEDVAAYYDRMANVTPADPEAVLYDASDPNNPVYVVKAKYMEDVIAPKVSMYDIMMDEEHVPKFVGKYHPDTIKEGFSRSMVDMGIGAGGTLAIIFGLLGL